MGEEFHCIVIFANPTHFSGCQNGLIEPSKVVKGILA
jgi:hypothetical protein